MKRLLVIFALLASISSYDASAWGRHGHDAIAYIAELNLNPRTKEIVENYLDGKSIVYVASWPDQIRFIHEYAHIYPSHSHIALLDENLKVLPRGASDALNMSMDISSEMISATNIVNTLSSVAGAVLKNPMTYVNLMNMVEEERMYHKMANLENDYQEFNNQLQAAQKVLNQLYQSTNSTMTAEYLCTYQLIMGRAMSLFPEVCLQMTPEQFITTSLTTGSDIIKCVLGSVPMYVENQMSMNGFSPESLHYSQNDNSIV